MTYLVDTDYVADYLGGMSWAQELLQAHAAQGLSISLMTLGEIYEGIEYGRDPQAAERVFRTFLAGWQPTVGAGVQSWLSRLAGLVYDSVVGEDPVALAPNREIPMAECF